MKHLTSILLTGMLALSSLPAQVMDSLATEPVSQELTLLAEEVIYPSLLWEISSPNLPEPSYLYGTIHIIPKDSFFLTKEVEKGMGLAQRLVLEMPLDMGMSTLLTSLIHMKMPAGESIQKYLDEESYAYLKGFLKDSVEMQLPYSMIRPFYTTQQVQLDYCMSGPTESYEMVFSERFKQAGKPIDGLESLKDQLKLVDDIPIEDQVAGLMSLIRNPQMACEQLSELVHLYRQQDLDGLMRLTQEDEMSEEELARFLGDRNQRWISKIEAFLAKEVVFIAVGAGHLAGEQGVIELLRKQGYTLRPL